MTTLADMVQSLLRMKERASAPASPDAGYGYVYIKTDKKFYIKNSDGTEVCISNTLANPMSAAGDLIIGGTGGAPARLAKATDAEVLTLVSGAPAWATPAGGTTISRITGTVLYDSGALGAAAEFDTGTIDFTGSIYATMELMDARAVAGANNCDVKIAFNNDTTDGNYSSTVGSSTSDGNANARNITNVSAGNDAAGFVTTVSFRILNPAGGSRKNIFSDGYQVEGAATAARRQYNVVWDNTAAITRIHLSINNATTTFLAGSRLMVIGWKVENILTP